MSQFRPSSLIPSTLTESYSIDATVVNEFRCQINGTSPTTRYRIKIMKNDSLSTLVYDSGIVTLATPIYPVNFDGAQNELIVSVPSNSGMVNGNQYKWTVASYWSATEFMESYENVFNAYSAPLLYLNTIPSTISGKSYVFTAYYSQAQGVSVERFGWQLRNFNTKDDIVNTIDSNNIYSSNLKLSYDGLFTGTSYEIKIKCWLSNGISVETSFFRFDVSYLVEPFAGDVNTTKTNDGGILLQWPNVNFISGIPSGTYDYSLVKYEYIKSYCLHLNSGSTVTFNNINTVPIKIPSSSTHIISFFMEKSSVYKSVYKAVGIDGNGNPISIELIYQNSQFKVVYNSSAGTDVRTLYNSGTYDFWYVFAITNGYVYYSAYSSNMDALYPSTTLYPSNTLYPKSDTFSPSTNGRVSAPILNGDFSQVVLTGEQYTNYLWIVDGTSGMDMYASLRGDISIQPDWTIDTILLAKFENNLSAGNYAGASDLTAWLVYREDENSSVLKMVERVPPQTPYVFDYGVSNENKYRYYVFPEFVAGIGAPLMSDYVSTMWWDWILIVCDEARVKELYYVGDIYRFDLDLSSGAMNNNTTFTTLENFTKYAKIQHSNSNYWSGTLTALIGNCANTYSDSVELMNKLKSLSTDRRTKFLKDRKGNLWKVRISAPVSEQMADQFIEQQVSITLNWMEIGDSSLSSIVRTHETTPEDMQDNLID